MDANASFNCLTHCIQRGRRHRTRLTPSAEVFRPGVYFMTRTLHVSENLQGAFIDGLDLQTTICKRQDSLQQADGIA